MEFKIVEQKDISFESNKWNGCVHYAMNGLPYGYTWFLDAVSKDWIGVVENDYESVFPLFYRKNFWGKKILYAPSVVPMSGIYSVNMMSNVRVENMIKAIPPEFQFDEIELFGYRSTNPISGFVTSQLELSTMFLNQSYDELFSNYSDELKDILQEIGTKYTSANSMKPEVFSALVKKYGAKDLRDERTFHAIQRIIYNFLHRGTGSIYSFNDKNGHPAIAAFVVYSHNIIWIPFWVTVPSCAKMEAMAVLIDMIIQSNADRPIALQLPKSVGSLQESDFDAKSEKYIKLIKK